jgi:cysteine desulfurase
LQDELVNSVPSVMVMGGNQPRVPGTANLAFEFIEGEAILLLLNQAGIAASSGSACTSGSLEPSHVMRAMNIPYTAAHGTIRFSCHATRGKKRLITSSPRCRRLSPGCGCSRLTGRTVNRSRRTSSFAPVYG